jgi:hypothetical protein
MIEVSDPKGGSAEKSAGELFESFIAGTLGVAADCLHMDAKSRVSPVEAGRLLGIAGSAFAGGFEQHLRRCRLERGIVARREVKIAMLAGIVAIVVDKCA